MLFNAIEQKQTQFYEGIEKLIYCLDENFKPLGIDKIHKNYKMSITRLKQKYR